MVVPSCTRRPEWMQEQRRTRTRPGRQSGYDGKNKSVKILFLKAEDVIKMVLAAGGGGKSTWAGSQFNPKVPPLQKKGKIRCWRWTEISLVGRTERLKAGRHRQPDRQTPTLAAQSEGDDPWDSLPPRTDRTEKAHSRKWRRRKQMEEQRRRRAAFRGVLSCGGAAGPGHGQPSQPGEETTFWGQAAQRHPCRSAVFEGRNLTDILKGFAEDVLDGSF